MRSLLACLAIAIMTLAAAPATQPSAVAPRVAVQSFQSVDSSREWPWLGNAIQQSLMADLSGGGLLQPVAEDRAPQYVINGNYQIVEENLRITAQIVDANSGTIVGGLKATGLIRDLFQLEDDLARSARNQLLKPAANQSTASATTNPQQPVVINITAGGALSTARGSSSSYEGSNLERIANSDYAPSQKYALPRDYAADSARYYYYSGDYQYPYYPYYGYGWGYSRGYSGGWWGWPNIIITTKPIHHPRYHYMWSR